MLISYRNGSPLAFAGQGALTTDKSAALCRATSRGSAMSRWCSEQRKADGLRAGLRLAMMVFGAASSSCLLAQGTGDIVGTITDNTGGVLASAKVTAKNLATAVTRSTEADAR